MKQSLIILSFILFNFHFSTSDYININTTNYPIDDNNCPLGELCDFTKGQSKNGLILINNILSNLQFYNFTNENITFPDNSTYNELLLNDLLQLKDIFYNFKYLYINSTISSNVFINLFNIFLIFFLIV